MTLTDRDRDVLTFIRDFQRREGYSPTNREIGEGCYMCPTAAYNRIKRLQAMGYLTTFPMRARAIVLHDRPILPKK